MRKKLSYPELKRAVVEQDRLFRPQTIVIEDRASGTQLIQDLIDAGLSHVARHSPDGDKIMRLHAQTATIENGFVFLPDETPWLADYSLGGGGSDAVLWSASTGEGTDLGSLLGANWTDSYATGINELGDIIGYGDYQGATYGFLLTPTATVPEPSTWAMPLVGFAGLAYAGSRASRKSVAATRCSLIAVGSLTRSG